MSIDRRGLRDALGCFATGVTIVTSVTRDGILLGGSFQRNDFSLEPDPALTASILRGNKEVFDSMRR